MESKLRFFEETDEILCLTDTRSGTSPQTRSPGDGDVSSNHLTRRSISVLQRNLLEEDSDEEEDFFL